MYKWADGHGAKQPLDAETTAKELKAISQTYGAITPENIIKEAKKKRHPLHGFFEWDDSVAAHHYRLHEARLLVNHIIYVSDDKPEQTVRAFVNVSGDEQRRYEPITTVLGNPVTRDELLARAWKELESWKRRYQELEEFAQIFKAIERKAS